MNADSHLILKGERKPPTLDHYRMNLEDLREKILDAERKDNGEESSRIQVEVGDDWSWRADPEEQAQVNGRVVYNEMKFGYFQRVIKVPANTRRDAIKAHMDDGILTVCWPLPPLNDSVSNGQPVSDKQEEVDGDAVMSKASHTGVAGPSSSEESALFRSA